MEHWGEIQNEISSAIHTTSSFMATVNKGIQNITNASTEFHTYTLIWTEEKMEFSVDGITHYIYNPPIKNDDNWPFNLDQFILLNVAILPSISPNFTESPLEIDYIRIYQESTASTVSSTLNEISLYPNPINDSLTIKIPNLEVGMNVNIYSLTGSKVKTFSIDKANEVLDCSSLSKGVYFLKVNSTKKVETFKIIKN